MVRLILYFALVAGIATGLAWVADRPGSLTVDWLGYEVKTSVFIGGLVLIIFFAAFVLAVWLGILTWTAPRRIARRLQSRKRRIGHEALRRGIFAAGAGDRIAAMKAGAIAKKNLPEEPLSLLLEAQSAQLNEDPIASRQAFERMLEKPEMAELGLRGLFIEAKKAGQLDAAKQFAEKALAANPALTWPSAALFDMQCRESDWRGALKTLGTAKANRHLAKAEADRRRALLLTALAAELEDTQQSKALAYAQEAYTLDPSLTPASVIAARVLASQGNVARATKLTAQAWRMSPHPDLALIHAHARTGDSPRDRLARVKSLTESAPRSLEGDIAIAVAAIEAKDWTTARTALEPYLASTPPARVCRLMARIEAGQNRDAGRAREWLAKAARGAPDPMWVASDGSVSAEWQPISPVSGTLGAFEWKTPPAAPQGSSADIIEEMKALDLQAIEPWASSASIIEGEAADATGRAMTVTVTREPAGHVGEPGSPVERTAEEGKAKGAASPSPAAARGIKDIEDIYEFDYAGDAAPPDEKGVQPSAEAAKPAKPAAPEKASPPKINLGEQPKAEARKPKIFVPGPAPDDPGPRRSDNDEESTLLSRFRRPT
jgi:HemY protein